MEERTEQQEGFPPETQYVWGIRYVDEVILRDVYDAGIPLNRLYALQDANFNVTGIVNTAGLMEARFSYTPYGMRTLVSGTDFDWNIGHQGLMHDTESGLIYNRARMLHPALGRFIQRDPLGYVDGMNLYALVMNNPIRMTDSQGLSADDFTITPQPPRHTFKCTCTCISIDTGELMWKIDAEWISPHECPNSGDTCQRVCDAACSPDRGTGLGKFIFETLYQIAMRVDCPPPPCSPDDFHL